MAGHREGEWQTGASPGERPGSARRIFLAGMGTVGGSWSPGAPPGMRGGRIASAGESVWVPHSV